MTGSSITGSLGTGRIYGDHIALSASTLTNDAETVDGVTHAPVIVARNRLDIGATTLINREHALLFSAGDLAIGGALDASHQATGQGATLTNQSATIEALGSLDLAIGQITNSNAHLVTRLETLGSEYIVEYQGNGSPTLYREGTPGVYIHNDESDQLMTPEGNFETWLAYRYTRSSSETRVVTSDPAQLLSGSAMRIRADRLVNDNSRIIAGGALNATLGSLTNSEAPAEHIDSASGVVTAYWRDHHRGRDSTGSSSLDYTPPSSVRAIPLGITAYLENTAHDGSGTQITDLALGHVGQNAAGAGQAAVALNVSGTPGGSSAPDPVSRLGDTPAAQVNADPGNTPITTLNAPRPPAATPTEQLTATPPNPLANATRSAIPNTTLPDSSLFHTNPSPTAREDKEDATLKGIKGDKGGG